MGMTVSQYAKHRGVSRQAIHKALKVGRLTAGPDGSIDPYLADRALDGTAAPVASGARLGGGARDPQMDAAADDVAHQGDADRGLTVPEANARYLAARARLVELKLADERGEIVRVEDARKTWFAVLKALRDRLLLLPDRMRFELAGLTDPRAVGDAMDREIRALLQGLPDEPPADPS